MKTSEELRQLLDGYKWEEMNTHVHSVLCDGKPEMTLQNIVSRAVYDGVKLIVLVPHYHKCLTDGQTTIYTDTSDGAMYKLRQIIDDYHRKDGSVRFLLSVETDILDLEGHISLPVKRELEEILDFITPTMNFHPLLPYRALQVTNPKTRDQVHISGDFAAMVESAGGMGNVVTGMYEAQANAILNAPYTAMLGHFFSAHSRNGNFSWFGLQEQHLPQMKIGARKVIDACAKKKAVIDITGIRIPDTNIAAKRDHDGFLYDFQKWFLDQCKCAGVGVYPGADAHELSRINGTWFYEALYYGG